MAGNVAGYSLVWRSPVLQRMSKLVDGVGVPIAQSWRLLPIAPSHGRPVRAAIGTRPVSAVILGAETREDHNRSF